MIMVHKLDYLILLVSESKKELKDKHLLEDTKKLYDELKQDKEILGKYYSSNIKLTRDMKNLLMLLKTDSNALLSNENITNVVNKLNHAENNTLFFDK